MEDITSQNPTIFQSFEWNLPATRTHYTHLTRLLPALRHLGVTALWLPPACKAGNSTGNGYDIYDLYDLGEFDQRGSVPTKWGTKDELLTLCAAANEIGFNLYFDAVLNHRCGGDDKQLVRAVEVDSADHTVDTCEEKEVEVWLRYKFAGREGRYSDLQYDWRIFNASDWDDREQKHGIYRIVDGGKRWASDVSGECGNGDYLMFNNLDYAGNEALRRDVMEWGLWVTKELGLSGFRLDAMQHFSQQFSSEWIEYVRRGVGKDVFVVGEYWCGDVDTLMQFLNGSPRDIYLYDAPLLYNFGRLSYGRDPDLRTVFEKTLVKCRPCNAVTLVMNHDTQKGQVMDTPIHPKFTSLAYALILFRETGYPCVFYGDMYGTSEPFLSSPTCDGNLGNLGNLILARKLYAYGEQQDYFQDPDCIGWVRRGIPDTAGSQASGMAVVMNWVGGHMRKSYDDQSILDKPRWMRRLSGLTVKFGFMPKRSPHCEREMNVGSQHAGEVWTDVLNGHSHQVTIRSDGTAVFPCEVNSVAVYVSDSAVGRRDFSVPFA